MDGIDWEGLLLAPLNNVFGESVTFTPAGADPIVIRGIYDEAYQSLEMMAEGMTAGSSSPALGVMASSFPTGTKPEEGDTVSIPKAKATFLVREVQPDGHGHIHLLLNFLEDL